MDYTPSSIRFCVRHYACCLAVAQLPGACSPRWRRIAQRARYGRAFETPACIRADIDRAIKCTRLTGRERGVIALDLWRVPPVDRRAYVLARASVYRKLAQWLGDLVSPVEASRILGVSDRTVRRWVASGRLVGVRYPSGTCKVVRAAIEATKNPAGWAGLRCQMM